MRGRVNNKFYWSLFLIVLVSSAFVLKNDKALGLKYPNSWPKPNYDFNKNPLTDAKIFLGRNLFYDPILSKNNTISCASCHLSFTAFTHVDHALSHGIYDSIGTRNSPALMNLAWSNSLMWDGSANHLDMQALAPIESPVEMGENFAHVIEKLKLDDKYVKLFNEAYGDDEITGERFLKALAAFELTLISANSKYDKVQRGDEVFTEQEQKGLLIFNTHCNNCHTAPLFTNNTFQNNGLPLDSTLMDYGRGVITGKPKDNRKFKVPTLRNIEFSFPYMHDGRFTSLYQVLNHYNSGIEFTETLHKDLKGGVKLSDDEKVDLVAFLLTLSDKEFCFNPEFGFPRK